jgi:Beta-lactamase enzyme family
MRNLFQFIGILKLAALATLQAATTPFESAVLTAVQQAKFSEVIDFGAGNEERPVRAHLGEPARRIAQPPNVDVAVIQFDEQGRPVARAEVLLSRDYPAGVIVALDADRGAVDVRFLRWDIDRSNGGTVSREDGRVLKPKDWTNNPPITEQDDLVPGRTHAPLQFMAPYPASLFKTMVAFHVLRMVDAGKITLDADYTYAVTGAQPETRKVRDWIDPMIVVSDNHATSALLKLLHDRREIENLNREFRELNLPTLQINATAAADGLGWQPGQIHMTAYDTARLFWLIDGGPGVFWLDAGGKPVTEKVLSEKSRAFFKKVLGEQAFNECLSTANFPGAKNVRPGIPSRVSNRWINPTNGHVVVEGMDFGIDIRPMNRQAEVEFLHKTGLTFNYASNAGIVRSLPGKPFRHYIIAFLANLGNRYADEVFADSQVFPAFARISPTAYTQRIPALGKAVDDLVKKFSTQEP